MGVKEYQTRVKLETEVRNIVDNMLHTCKYCPVFNLKKEFQQTI